MHAFEKIFPADDFALLAVILAMPLLGAFVNGIFGKRLGRDAVRLMALSALGISFLGSVLAFCLLHAAQTGGEGGGEEAARFVWHAWEWMGLSRAGEASLLHSGAAPGLLQLVDRLDRRRHQRPLDRGDHVLHALIERCSGPLDVRSPFQ